MGNLLWKIYPTVNLSYPSVTDPKAASWVSDPLDQYFSPEDCWSRVIHALKVPRYPWTRSWKVVRESDYEFAVMEKVVFWERSLTGRHIINPKENMVESMYVFSKEFPKYKSEDPLFMQWIVVHTNPLRIEGWRRRMDNHDMLHDEGTVGFFNELLKALVNMKPEDMDVMPSAYDDYDPEEEAQAERKKDQFS
mmetsp:Transcript_53162/g.147283  ORF Transcript_53162/g.147283 Transcript_53162/m.147283 type:complete len:193 (-) Transcript_53162:80-658(-)